MLKAGLDKEDLQTSLLLHLSLIPGVGAATILKVIQQVPLTPSIKKTIDNAMSDKSLLNHELDLIKKYKIKVVTILDDDYPESLAHIYLPPPVLYCLGSPIGKEFKLAIVGSRKASSYSQKVCNSIVKDLVNKKITIVSGGARGADAMAHKATLDCGGKTIAVLGSGLLKPYPKENITLFREIIKKGGTIVSPFPLATEPLRGNFPARNRIIAGLSEGCIVVQAAEKSGASITANFALEQGKQVYAVPGSIFDEFSEGCHSLIKQGAKLVSNTNDILEEL